MRYLLSCTLDFGEKTVKVTFMRDPIDAQMQAAQGGDEKAYRQVLETAALWLRPYAARAIFDQTHVDDVVQEILISVHRARHTYDPAQPFRPWLFAIAKYRLMDYLRRHYRDHLARSENLDDWQEFLPDPVTQNPMADEDIHRAIHQLPKKQAMIIQMMHFDGLTAQETGQRMGMKAGTVKVNAHRAYQRLRKLLEAA